ncbi:MAG: SUF system NifU family Fe-S cluster assembly protein [Ignavibacteria bacterium]|nr:SUF system NifU family Fe-S cluster assembly protein [Ignavibacteria bacterium]
MSELHDLYQEVILDHNKSPRNFGPMEDADLTMEGYNPLCGDHYTVYVRMDGDVVSEVHFEGAGCAISKSSASVMTQYVRGKTREEVEAIFDSFHNLVRGKTDPAEAAETLGKLAVFSGVSEFPARVKCASLPWHTLKGALEHRKEPITTE